MRTPTDLLEIESGDFQCDAVVTFFTDGIRSCFTFKTLEISKLGTDYLIQGENRHYDSHELERGLKYKKTYYILFGMWEYGEINEISQHMRLLFNA